MGVIAIIEPRKPSGLRGGSGELEREGFRNCRRSTSAALRRKWAALFGADPSPYLGRMFMVRAIAYRMQERLFGGLKPATQRVLDRFSEARGKKTQPSAPRQRAGAGTVLIRQWKGVQHRVTVLDSDVLYRGRRYKSLSEVARTITGTHWSGPLFFGLKKRTKEQTRG